MFTGDNTKRQVMEDISGTCQDNLHAALSDSWAQTGARYRWAPGL